MLNKGFLNFFLTYIKDTSDAIIIASSDNKVEAMSDTARYILPGIDEGYDLSSIASPEKLPQVQTVEFYEYDADVMYHKDDGEEFFIYKFHKSTYAISYEYSAPSILGSAILENLSSNMYNPLSAIFSLANSLLKSDKNSLSSKSAKDIDNILQNSYKLLKLANNMEAVVSRNTSLTNLPSIDISKFCYNVIQKAQPICKKYDCEMKFFAPSKRLVARVDTVRLERIVLMMISNSIKRTKGGASIVVTVSELPTHISLSFSDGARPFTKEELDSIFIPELPLNPDTFDLVVIRFYLEQLNGRFIASVDKDNGSKLTVLFPKGNVRENLHQKSSYTSTGSKLDRKYIDLSDIAHFTDFD